MHIKMTVMEIGLLLVYLAQNQKKIENLIDGKKFSSDSDTEGYDAVIKYNGNEYYYVSKTKMLITSEKGAKLSDSENAEVKKILKID